MSKHEAIAVAGKDRLWADLERADRIIGWMASHLGRMAPPSNGIVDLNEHWIEMQVLGINQTRDVDWRGPRGADERPLDQRPSPSPHGGGEGK